MLVLFLHVWILMKMQVHPHILYIATSQLSLCSLPPVTRTYGQGHDPQLAPHQLHNHALLEWCGAAAEHGAAVLSQLQKLLLQLSLEDSLQCPSIDNEPHLRQCHRAPQLGPMEFAIWSLWSIALLHLLQRTVQDGLAGLL